MNSRLTSPWAGVPGHGDVPRTPLSRRTFNLAAFAGVLAVAGCGSSNSAGSTSTSATPSYDPNAKVTIKVQGLAPGADKAAQAALAAQVKSFEAKYPNITINTVEWQWDRQQFATELAGGTLPIEFSVPFTDGPTLIENEQVLNLDPYIKNKAWYGKFTKAVATPGEDSSGAMWMVPYNPYGMALTYNRTLFTQAGLDPDNPPTTWDAVRSAAKQIAQKTGKTGYAQMTKESAGGWLLTTIDYALGGRIEQGDATKATANVASDTVKKQLNLLKAMRWDDNSMGSQMLYDWGTINADFAAGKIGMFVGGSDLYTPMIQMNKMDPKIYGLAPIPTEGTNGGVLGGGALSAVSAKASPNEAYAAVQWIDFVRVQTLFDKDAAIADAKTQAANKQPVGVPGFPLFDKSTYEQHAEWIKDYVNVPLAQFKPYTDKMFGMNLVAEPPIKTQDVYAALAPMVQKVLTDRNASVDDLVATYQT